MSSFWTVLLLVNTEWTTPIGQLYQFGHNMNRFGRKKKIEIKIPETSDKNTEKKLEKIKEKYT